jgi:hypothetical protein
MAVIRLDHFGRAAAEIGAHGDNDTLPFDIDNRFVKDNEAPLSELAFAYCGELAAGGKKHAKNAVDSVHIFSERLLVPTGPTGFRITTKVHPFWNVYFNGLGVAIAEALEPQRSERAHSYRFAPEGKRLFDRTASWRAFREATISDCLSYPDGAVVVQTDISSFYEHVSHHRIENCIDDLFPNDETIAAQVDRLLNRFASGRSFGLPVGGQCSRILAELLLSLIDRRLTDAKIVWRRYVDDFFLITPTQSEAYRALSILAQALADYGLTLNRTKTTLLKSTHYVDYVRAQLGIGDDEGSKLLEIDLHFDPYSDTADSDYAELKRVVDSLDVSALLDMELEKGQPDTFLVSQIGRTLRLLDPSRALQLCDTLLGQMNLHAFRASWSTIMRGVAQLRADEAFQSKFPYLDKLLDAIPQHSSHLLTAEASILHYLRTIRFQRTDSRAQYVLDVHASTGSQTVKRACIECWKTWKDRSSFTRERNRWNSLQPEEQRMLWLAAADFGDEGEKFRKQVRQSLPKTWELGIERNNRPTFTSIYTKWGGGSAT